VLLGVVEVGVVTTDFCGVLLFCEGETVSVMVGREEDDNRSDDDGGCSGLFMLARDTRACIVILLSVAVPLVLGEDGRGL
jgi:hypothetical protein